ncbi:TonB-dependent receptor, partial [Sinorhizobium meliloti]
ERTCLPDGSGVNREVHAPFYERPAGEIPPAYSPNTIGQKGFFLVDLGLSWKVSEQVVADVFVNNVFDETYAVYGFTEATYGNLYQLGTGRAFGGRVSFKF